MGDTGIVDPMHYVAYIIICYYILLGIGFCNKKPVYNADNLKIP